MNLDPKIVAFNAWRKRRALEAGLQSPEALLDEWKFKRILIADPKDIYDLENLRLLTAPLFAQYGEDLLRLAQGRPTTDELSPAARRRLLEDDGPSTPRVRGAGTIRHTSTRPSRTVVERAGVRRDDPVVKLHQGNVSSDRKVIVDFHPAEAHQEWKAKPFEFGCQTLSFKYWETEFLEAWGALLDDLVSGVVSPESEDEKAVLQIARRERKASKEWEMALTKLVLRRTYENS
ncbi:MAG: hypothetical protein H6686_06305 [Fibrobacteria bacterium]|nr:hypothetical protein [Fibrobacteria bacterium]